MPLTPLLFAGKFIPANQKKTPIEQPPQFASSANITARKPLTHDSVSFSNTHNQPHFGADAPLPPPGGGGWDPFSQWASEPTYNPYDNSGWNPLLGRHGEFMPQEEGSGAVLSEPSTQKTGKKPAKDLSSKTLRGRAAKAKETGDSKLANDYRQMARAKETPQRKTPKRPNELSPTALRRRATKVEEAGDSKLADQYRQMARAKDTPQLKTPKRPDELTSDGLWKKATKVEEAGDSKLADQYRQIARVKARAKDTPQRKTPKRPDELSPTALRRRATKVEEAGDSKLADQYRQMARAKDTPQLKAPKPLEQLGPVTLWRRAAKAEEAGKINLANDYRQMARAKTKAGAHSQLGSGVSESEQGGYSSTSLTGPLRGLQVQQPLNMQQLLSDFRETGQVDTNIPQDIHQALISRLYQRAAKQTDAQKQQRELGFSNDYQRAVENAFPVATRRFERLLGNLDEINSQAQGQQVASLESTGSGHETEDEQWSTKYQHLEWFKRNGRYHDKDGNPV